MLNGLSCSVWLTVWKPDDIWSVSNLDFNFMANSYAVTRRLQISVRKKTKTPIFVRNRKSHFHGGKSIKSNQLFFHSFSTSSSKIEHQYQNYFNSVFASFFYNTTLIKKSNIKLQHFFSLVSESLPPQKSRFTYFWKLFFEISLKQVIRECKNTLKMLSPRFF